ncbi:hypothetical protein BGZ65_007813 [Modicella reniformis]|uniref:FAD-binding domain-containing protein n=1 Tax=Modicella reniformis TaxID=1440133 RepID=A0A9P6MF80_9FUNG|nr:hypothetical protein BGZ65_007813 [Modicella reniformis]
MFDDLMKNSFTSNSMPWRGLERDYAQPEYGLQKEFYDLLLSQIPPEKIHFGKKVLSIKHPTEGGVSINCSDNTAYSGDILVGADGAYSGVRQSLYRMLEDKSLLPDSDTQGFQIGYMTMVGTTDPLDQEKCLQAKGLGAVNALQDAIILANHLYDIAQSPTSENITRAFQKYKDGRYSRVQAQFKASKIMGRVLFGAYAHVTSDTYEQRSHQGCNL